MKVIYVGLSLLRHLLEWKCKVRARFLHCQLFSHLLTKESYFTIGAARESK